MHTAYQIPPFDSWACQCKCPTIARSVESMMTIIPLLKGIPRTPSLTGTAHSCASSVDLITFSLSALDETCRFCSPVCRTNELLPQPVVSKLSRSRHAEPQWWALRRRRRPLFEAQQLLGATDHAVHDEQGFPPVRCAPLDCSYAYHLPPSLPGPGCTENESTQLTSCRHCALPFSSPGTARHLTLGGKSSSRRVYTEAGRRGQQYIFQEWCGHRSLSSPIGRAQEGQIGASQVIGRPSSVRPSS